MSHTGILQKTEICPVSHSMSGTIPATITQMAGSEASSSAPDKLLPSAPQLLTPSLFGESSLMIPASKESIAPSLGTKAKSSQVSLSDRLTQSLISAGLVKGITPTSVRKQLGAVIPVTALWPLDGGNAEKPKVAY